jgi:hypothetical protein
MKVTTHTERYARPYDVSGGNRAQSHQAPGNGKRSPEETHNLYSESYWVCGFPEHGFVPKSGLRSLNLIVAVSTTAARKRYI